MSDRIQNILDEIKSLSKDGVFNSEWLNFKLLNIEKPIRKEKELFNLFPSSNSQEYDLDTFEEIIHKSKDIAKYYNEPKLVISERMYTKKIILYYMETEQEVYYRLCLEYESLLKERDYLMIQQKGECFKSNR